MAADDETGFREFEHSGDVGIEAWGETHAALIENATRGLFGLMVWQARGDTTAAGPVSAPPAAVSNDESRSQRTIEVHAASAADVLVDWLSEVITAAATHGEVYGDVTVKSADETSASGTIGGEPFDPARHERRFDVKAATYHGLVCEKTADGFHARIIFDL
jgi:SHS2 domain-containing protein